MLDFRTETFLTVCEYMNYTKVAEVLNMTQPAISGHIRYLENYYGVKLFVYENKKLSLTRQGERLKRALQTVVHDEKKLKKELASINEIKSYRIGATLSVGDAYLPEFMSEYLEKHKDVSILVTVANTSTLLNMLDKGMLDIVLTEGYFSKDDYENRLINEEPMTIICGRDYTAKKIKTISDLFSHRLISREKGSGTRAVFEHYLAENGYSIDDFSNICEFTSLNLITEMIMNNQGIGVLYKCVVSKKIKEGRLKEIRIPGFNITHDFNALWQKNSMYEEDNEQFLKELKQWQGK